jgi:hypothetical protein
MCTDAVHHGYCVDLMDLMESVGFKKTVLAGAQSCSKASRLKHQAEERFLFVADSCQPCLELPDVAGDPSEVSRVSESVSGREAKTETNKQTNKARMLLKNERDRDRDKGDMAADYCLHYCSTWLHVTRQQMDGTRLTGVIFCGRDGTGRDGKGRAGTGRDVVRRH